MRLFVDRDHEFHQSYFQEPGGAEAELEADVHGSIVGLFNGGFGNPCPGPRPQVRRRQLAGTACQPVLHWVTYG